MSNDRNFIEIFKGILLFIANIVNWGIIQIYIERKGGTALRKKIFYLFGISILLFLGSMYYLPALAADGEKIMITGDVVNVRKFPGTSNTIITQVRQGETFSVENHQDDWYEIKLSSGKKGWIANWLAEPVHSNNVSAKNAKITVDHLNVRSEGNLSGSIIGQLNKGDSVIVYEKRKIGAGSLMGMAMDG